MKLGETKPRHPKILIFGPPGCGKTALAQTIGGICQTRLFDFERGWFSGLTLKDKFTSARHNVDILGPTDSSGQPTGFVDLNPAVPQAWVLFMKVLTDYSKSSMLLQGTKHAWIFDSLTSMFEAALRQVVGQATPQIQHWGIAFHEMLNALAFMKSLPGVVLLLAHDQRDSIKKNKDDKDAQQIIEIAVPGKNLPSKITSYFDEVWYMNTVPAPGNRIERKLQTLKDAMIPVRSRYQLPDMTLADRGLPEILDSVGFKFE
jgi:energy-coupling factor transporter ATP-binding protein EcfA2